MAFCEIEPFPRRVLAKHWPEVPCYEDVTKLTGDILRRDGIAVDVITGGFPCQDISYAGKQRGMDECTRSGLWSEIVRLIGELSPRYVIVENVAALLNGPSERRGGWFGRVLGDLAECGYDAEWENIPASALGAPHRRERVWIVAHRNGGDGQPGAGKRPELWGAAFGERADNDACGAGVEPKALAHTDKIGRPKVGLSYQQGKCGEPQSTGQTDDAFSRSQHPISRRWGAEPAVGRVANGVPDRSHRLAALGNAVVPQIPELIGRAILAAEGKT